MLFFANECKNEIIILRKHILQETDCEKRPQSKEL